MKLKRMMATRLPAFTLTELMMVLVIIGILILLALPNLQGIIGQAYSVEAKKQLSFIQSLETSYYHQNFRYSDNFTELRFDPPKLRRDGGEGLYIYEVVSATKQDFLVRATASEDFDGDGQINVWEIRKDGSAVETVLD